MPRVRDGAGLLSSLKNLFPVTAPAKLKTVKQRKAPDVMAHIYGFSRSPRN